MTAEGHAALDAELKHLKSVERPAVIQAISEAREHGDLSENAEYHAAKEKQSFIEGRVAELEDKLARAEVIDVTKLKGDKVRLCSLSNHPNLCGLSRGTALPSVNHVRNAKATG